jgi:hypothetical protein
MVRGHGIKTLRRGQRTVPDWAKDKRKLQSLLLQSFPKMAINVRQRTRAGRWARIIYLYYNLNLTSGQIAKELEAPVNNIKRLLVSIHRASRGLRCNAPKKRSTRPVGRPKKSV